MAEQKVGIVAECICDLPKSYLQEHNVGLIYFLIKIDSGVFTDTDEVTAENIMGYMEDGGRKAVSSPPPADVYESLFRKTLETYDEAVFISIGSNTSVSYPTALEAVKNMGEDGKRVRVIDSLHLSTGLGHIIIKAVELAEAGHSADEIVSEITEYRHRISTTFIAKNADYLYINGRVSLKLKKICNAFHIHPVLTMKNGGITLKSIMIGSYEKASLRYVKKELKNAGCIDKRRIFITHVGLSKRMLNQIKNVIYRRCKPDELIETKASATISSNCGPGTFGVLFVNKK